MTISQSRREFLATTAGAAAAYGTMGATFARAETPKDTIVMAKQIDDIISLDPAESFEFSGGEVTGNVYDRLIGYDLADPSKLFGDLASGWTISADSMTYTFKLKPGLKFHSGNPMTAADVVYSFQRAVVLNKSPGFILTQFGFSKENVLDKIKAVDDLTVTMTVDKPYAPTFFLNCLTAQVGSIVDSKTVKANAKGDDFGNEWMKANSAGSGAFILKGWKANEQYALEASTTWHNGPLKVKRVIVRHVPEPASQRLLLEKGDVDYARNLTKDQLEAIKGNAALAQIEGDKGRVMYLGLNQKNANLAKPEVREALKWLVDYDAIEANIVRGTYKPHQAFLPKGFLGALPERPYKFDLAKGKDLLAKAGLAAGFSVTMDVRSAAPFTDIAQAIQATWAQAGVKIELLPGDGKATLTKYRARTHDIYIGEWGPDYQDPHTNAETFAVNETNADDAKSKTLAWRNSWDIPEMTKMTLAAVRETDADKRKATYEALQREHQKVSPFVIMFQQVEVAVSRKDATGLILGPGSASNFYKGLTKA